MPGEAPERPRIDDPGFARAVELEVHNRERLALDDRDHVETVRLEPELAPDLDELWALHPEEFHAITMVGRVVPTPRWTQAYGVDYRFSGNVNRALPVPALLQPLLRWAQGHLHAGLNALLVNWYGVGRMEPARGQGDAVAVLGEVWGCAPRSAKQADLIGRIGPGARGPARAEGSGDLVGIGDGANDPHGVSAGPPIRSIVRVVDPLYFFSSLAQRAFWLAVSARAQRSLTNCGTSL